MKTININLEIPCEEQELNISIVVRKGGEVELNTLPPQPKKPIQKDDTIIPKTTVDNKNLGEEKSLPTDEIEEKSNPKPVRGNYMDMDF